MIAKFTNLPISQKFWVVLVVLLLPNVGLNYSIIMDKTELISFAQKEIEGAKYIVAAHEALIASTSLVPNTTAMRKAAASLRAAEEADKGMLDVSKKTTEVVSELESATPDVHELSDKIAALIVSIADNSNITLEPDLDSYYLGDSLTAQAVALMLYAQDIGDVALKVQQGAALDASAYAVDVERITGAGQAFLKDATKAIDGNPEGDVKVALTTSVNDIQSHLTRMAGVMKSMDPRAVAVAADELHSLAATYVVKANPEFTKVVNTRIAEFRYRMLRSLGFAGFLAVMGIFMATSIIRSITKPVGVITGLMGRLTAGDLSIEVPHLSRTDEIGVLSSSLESLHTSAMERERARVEENIRLAKEAKRAETIQNTTRQFESKVQGIVSTVAAAATQLAHTAQQMTKIMQQASANTNQAVMNASETSGNVSSVAAAAEEMAASVREISSQVQKTNALVRDSQDKTIAADEKALALTDASAKVRDAVTLIATISSKINLLALNATIESARAGEAGRGFAVVASEVKVLANQTNQSLEDIGRVIEGMDMASSAITLSLTNIKGAVEQVSIASNSIAAAVEEQSATTSEITRNMQSAAQGTQLISTNLGTVSQSSNDATASAGEVLSAAQELSRQAEELNREVNDFLEIIKAA